MHTGGRGTIGDPNRLIFETLLIAPTDTSDSWLPHFCRSADVFVCRTIAFGAAELLGAFFLSFEAGMKAP